MCALSHPAVLLLFTMRRPRSCITLPAHVYLTPRAALFSHSYLRAFPWSGGNQAFGVQRAAAHGVGREIF